MLLRDNKPVYVIPTLTLLCQNRLFRKPNNKIFFQTQKQRQIFIRMLLAPAESQTLFSSKKLETKFHPCETRPKGITISLNYTTSDAVLTLAWLQGSIMILLYYIQKPAPILDRDLWPTVGHLVHTIAIGIQIFKGDHNILRFQP